MVETESFYLRAGKLLAGSVVSALFGIVGGGLCGAAILAFGDFIGRSGSTGTEYFGYWNIDSVWLGMMYGGFFGALVGFIAYPLVVRKIGFFKAILPGFAGTLIGGFVGAVAGPPVAALTGIAGFFASLVWANSRLPASKA